MRVLARHDDAVFVDKPAGQLIHNSAWAGPRERTLVHDVRDAEGADLHPVHRLDRGASGVVLFARVVPRWQSALATGRKHYLALVRGHLQAAVDVDHPVKDEDGTPHDARSAIRPLLMSTVERCSLVEVELFTGRHHQVRRHLKHVSHPILGDATHGKGALNRDYAARYGLPRLALHAWCLEVPTGDAAAAVRVVAPLPDDLRATLTALFGDDVVARAQRGP